MLVSWMRISWESAKGCVKSVRVAPGSRLLRWSVEVAVMVEVVDVEVVVEAREGFGEGEREREVVDVDVDVDVDAGGEEEDLRESWTSSGIDCVGDESSAWIMARRSPESCVGARELQPVVHIVGLGWSGVGFVFWMGACPG
jgi:hypothetical protein